MKIQAKQLRWLGDSLEEVKTFSDEAKRCAGHQLGLIQSGLDPLDWKAMETVGAGAKKTQRTSKKDIDLSAERYRALIRARNAK